MDSSSMRNDQDSIEVLSSEARLLMVEAINLVLSRWTALKMAVDNGWGGRDSSSKAAELADAILSWFSQSKESLYIDDLENLLDETMFQSYNTEIEDGSVEEIAEQLMIIHEDLAQGGLSSIVKLRKAPPAIDAPILIRQMYGKEPSQSGSDVMADEPSVSGMMVDSDKQTQTPDEEGWCVAKKRNRGKK